MLQKNWKFSATGAVKLGTHCINVYGKISAVLLDILISLYRIKNNRSRRIADPDQKLYDWAELNQLT